jgi:hypothetical protein
MDGENEKPSCPLHFELMFEGSSRLKLALYMAGQHGRYLIKNAETRQVSSARVHLDSSKKKGG